MVDNPRIKPIEHATNRSWEEWLTFMDDIGAKNLAHPAIAAKVSQELKGKIDNPGWWAQGITVAYEQYSGRRVPGQRADGTFEMSVSKSTLLSMKELMEAWIDFASKDKEVLAEIAAVPRVSGTENRMNWRAKGHDRSSIIITSEPKKNGTASIIATLTGLQTSELSAAAKAQWAAILQRFLDIKIQSELGWTDD